MARRCARRVSFGVVLVLTVPLMPVPPASAAEPLPGLRAGDGAAVEGNAGSAMVRVPVTLSGPSATAVSVDYTTSPGSATAGTDYLSRRGTLRIPAGSTSAAVSLPMQRR